jgi:hypothetical protein
MAILSFQQCSLPRIPVRPLPLNFIRIAYAWIRYLFPCLVGASIGLCALLLAYAGLKETRPKRKRTLSESSSSSTITLVEELSPNPQPKTIREMLMYGPLQLVMASGFLISLLATAYDAVFALVCFTPIELGGLSLSVRPKQILLL